MNKTKRSIAALPTMLLVVSMLLAGCSSQKEIGGTRFNLPDPPSPMYVYDEADVLSSTAEHEIIAQNDALFAMSGAQIAVVCVRTTGETDISDYAYELFNKWGIGSAERNNGVLILLSIGEEDYWILQGIGLEDTLPSGVLKTMVNEYLEPYFAKGAYEDGVLALFGALRAHLESAYSIDLEEWDGAPGQFPPAQSDDTPAVEKENDGPSAAWILSRIVAVIIVLLLIAIIFNNRNGGGRHYYHPHGLSIHFMGIPIFRHNFHPGGHPGGHHGGFHGGHRGGHHGGFGGSRPGGGFSGGSRGGFGGGRSRGGGAGRR